MKDLLVDGVEFSKTRAPVSLNRPVMTMAPKFGRGHRLSFSRLAESQVGIIILVVNLNVLDKWYNLVNQNKSGRQVQGA